MMRLFSYKMFLTVLIYIFISYLSNNRFFIECQCVLPLSNGTWITSSRGTWIVPENGSQIQNFRASLSNNQQNPDLECITRSNSFYVLGTSVQVLTNIFITSYTCVTFQTTNHPSKYEMYFITGTDIATGEPFTSDLSTSCDGTVNKTASNTVIIIRDGTNADDIKQEVPNIVLGKFNIDFVDQNGAYSNNSQLDTCSDNTVFKITETINTTSVTSSIAFSASGISYSVKTWQWEGVTYIYTYNNDTTVDSSTTYRFSCWVMSASSRNSTVFATVAAEVCHVNQGPYMYNPPNGVQGLVLQLTVESDDSSDGISTRIIIIIVIACVIIIAVGILIIYCTWRRKQQNKARNSDKKAVVPSADNSTKSEIGNKQTSTKDLTAAPMNDEKAKSKSTKKKITRSIAVQASIWTAPIPRTVTALQVDTKHSNTGDGVKFLPYLKHPIQKPHSVQYPPDKTASITRYHTTLDSKTINQVQPIVRSKTNVTKNTIKHSNHYGKKSVSENKAKTISNKIDDLSTKTSNLFAYEFEKQFPFPMEGNPREFHNTMDVVEVADETNTDTSRLNNNDKGQPKSDREKSNVDKSEVLQLTETNLKSEYVSRARNSAKSRPSTSDGILGLRLQHTGSVRKTHSEGTKCSKSIMKFSYNSPYAMSEVQKEYLLMKDAWVRNRVAKNEENKKHLEEMKKLENQKAFDQWIKNKQNSFHNMRSKYASQSKKKSFKVKKRQ